MRSLVVSTLAALSLAVGVWAAETPKLDYSIEDQFGTTHTDEDCGGAVTLVIGSDRKGVQYIDVWGQAFQRALATELDDGTVCSVGFAHLKGAPFFVKKKIVASFSRDPDAWTLLDWKGYFAKTWGAEKDAANLYLFGRDGRLIFRETLLDFDQTQFDRIVAATRMEVAR